MEAKPTREWADTDDARMIDCPMFERLCRWQATYFIYAFRTDVTIDILRILYDLCGYDLTSLYSLYTDDMKGLPIFHAGEGERQTTYFEYGDRPIVSVPTMGALEGGARASSFDILDYKILVRVLVKGMERDIRNGFRVQAKDFPMPLPWREIMSRMDAMANTEHLLYRHGDFVRKIRFVDGCEIYKSAHHAAIIRLNMDFVDSLRKEQIHWFFLDEYLRLTDPVARAVSPRLHSERLSIQPET